MSNELKAAALTVAAQITEVPVDAGQRAKVMQIARTAVELIKAMEEIEAKKGGR